MTTVTTKLSVAELQHQSDRIGMKQESFTFGTEVNSDDIIQFEVTNHQTLIIRNTKHYKTRTPRKDKRGTVDVTEIKEIHFEKCNIDALILFLQDAKQFVQEDLMYRKIKGVA